MSEKSSSGDIEFIYDGQCPVCRFYADRVDIDGHPLVRIDARKPSEQLDRLTGAGLDIDQGMAVFVDDRIHFGSDAVRELALRSSRRGLLNRVTAAIFRRPWLANVVYPVLVGCRKLLLKMLRRPRINNLEKARGHRS